MPNALRIGLLGPLQVQDAAGRVLPVGGRQLRILFTLLALDAGRVVPSASLAGQLWSDDLPGNPGNALQTLISRLRAVLRRAGLASVIESHPAGYRLAVPPDAVDVAVFEAQGVAGRRALAAGDARAAARVLRDALLLWRGQALTDAAGCDFADAAAARLAELRSSVLADRIEADLALGEGASLVGELRDLLSADPLAERPRALLMRALYAAGRQAEAIGVYTEARELLADRLGVDPSAYLEQVYLRILRGEEGHAPPAGSPARAHSPLTSFVGRDEDVSRLLKNLGTARLVTLTGPGGVGKTRLATETSGRLDVPVWFVPLAPVTEASEVAYAVLDTLGIREPVIARRAPEPGAGPLDRLSAALSDRDQVIVMDNCEHVIEAAAALAGQVLATCPRMRIMTTSRQPLRIDGETLYPVSPLPVPPQPESPVPYEDYGSVRLLRDRAAAVRPDFELDDANTAAVGQICRALDGMPLAIELAAVWLRTLTPAQLAERLGDRFALLTGGSRTALPRHRTLRAVVDWSWDLLSTSERVLARRLALFPDGATLAAAEQVCADELLSAAEVLPALSGLVDKSILSAAENPEGAGTRYRMLETVRAYGLERLTGAGDEAMAQDAFIAYYLDLAETADPHLRGACQRRWLRELIAEQDNLHTALRWAIAARDANTALRFVQALGWYWLLRGQPNEPEELAREVLALEPRERSARLAEARVVCALTAAGEFLDVNLVRPPLVAAMADFAELSPGAAMDHPIAAMGEAMLALFDRAPERAFVIFDRYASSSDPWVRAIAPLMRAAFGSMLGQMDRAESDCRESLAAFRAIGDAWGSAATLVQLAEFAELKADYATAVAAIEEAETLAHELGAWGDLVHVSGKLAWIRMRMGDLEQAHADLARAEREEAGRGARRESTVWLGLVRAELFWTEGDNGAAARECTKALAWLDTQPSWWHGLRVLIEVRLAMIVLADGDQARCRGLLADALRVAAEWVENPAVAAVADAIAVLAQRQFPSREGATLAATLLGCGHSFRGCFHEASLDAPAARASARRQLGNAGFEAAYERGRALSRDDALALAADAVAQPVSAGS